MLSLFTYLTVHLKLNFGGSIGIFVGKYQTLTSGYSSSSSNEVHPSVSLGIIELVLLDMQKKTIFRYKICDKYIVWRCHLLKTIIIFIFCSYAMRNLEWILIIPMIIYIYIYIYYNLELDFFLYQKFNISRYFFYSSFTCHAHQEI
jgi:hypothetical protein